MSGVNDDVLDRLDDHEERVRAIERFQSWLVGIGVGVGGVVGFFIAVVQLLKK